MRTPQQTLNSLGIIAARAEAAMRGPWRIGHTGGIEHPWVDDCEFVSAELPCRIVVDLSGGAASAGEEDMRFIAAAREDVPDLVALVRELYASRQEDREKLTDALTVLRWARITDHPTYGLGVNQGLSTDAEARAALGRIAGLLK